MLEFLTRVRSWLGIPNKPDPEHDEVRYRLREQERRIRMARIDAGLPGDRRHLMAIEHPARRWTDR